MNDKKQAYLYGMRLRGFSPGCQPMEGLIRRRDDPTKLYHDLLEYNRELTWGEVRAYELDYLGNPGVLEVTMP